MKPGYMSVAAHNHNRHRLSHCWMYIAYGVFLHVTVAVSFYFKALSSTVFTPRKSGKLENVLELQLDDLIPLFIIHLKSSC